VVNLLPNVFDLNPPQDPKHDREITVLHYPADDHPKFVITAGFDTIFPFIMEAAEKNDRVLVHCGEGMSRAPSVVLGYLMKHRGMRLSEAIRYTIVRRPQVNPNNGFMRQLLEYERSIFNDTSVDTKYFVDDYGSGCIMFLGDEMKKAKEQQRTHMNSAG